MGQLKEKHGLTLLGNTTSGTCQHCAVTHESDMPHNQQSLTWQYKYYNAHGRFPTWADAMAHCTSEVQEVWAEALKEHGIEVMPGTGVAIEENYR